MAETLQEKYVKELLDPRLSKTPRENCAAAEIEWLRQQLPPGKVFESWNAPVPTPAEKARPEPGEAEVSAKRK